MKNKNAVLWKIAAAALMLALTLPISVAWAREGRPVQYSPAQIMGEAPLLQTTVTATTTRQMNLRAKPSASSKVIGWIPRNKQVPVLGRDSKSQWLYVEYGKKRGWIAGWLTTIQGDLGAVSVTNQVGGPIGNNPTPTPGQSLPPLTVSPLFQSLPAGSSAMFRLNADAACTHSYTFQLQELPVGVTAELVDDAAPCWKTLILNTAATMAPANYTVKVIATQTDTSQSQFAQITLSVTGCSEFLQGEFTQAIQSNLVTLITAGKPSVEHGLLVPLQVCRDRSLRVTLKAAISEAGTAMTTPPRFYLYRSLVWPAPNTITAHGLVQNVKLPRINSDGWQLQANIPSGLYLLVFERDYTTFPPISDPAAFPASVTYSLEATP